jgi:branched-chain amino acid transport system permease protein
MYFVVYGLDAVVLVALIGGMRSGFGRALRAIRTDQLAAAALGVNTVRYKLAAFVISAVLGSVAGSLYAFFFNFLSPEMVGTARSFELVAMLIVGGEGTLVGSLFGAMLLTLLPVIFQPLAIYKTLASGTLLVASFLYLPQGLYGAFVQSITRLAERTPTGVVPSSSETSRPAEQP